MAFYVVCGYFEPRRVFHSIFCSPSPLTYFHIFSLPKPSLPRRNIAPREVNSSTVYCIHYYIHRHKWITAIFVNWKMDANGIPRISIEFKMCWRVVHVCVTSTDIHTIDWVFYISLLFITLRIPRRLPGPCPQWSLWSADHRKCFTQGPAAGQAKQANMPKEG